MELIAPSQWRRIDFISDLHLMQQDGATYSAFEKYLASTQCDALFILGDLFEVWIGDDCISVPDSFEAKCTAAIAIAARRIPVYIMHGNRDFLMGAGLMTACGATFLEDPAVLVWAGSRWVLSHGDALCLDDRDYLKFRSEVRSAAWQNDFLAQPLSQRADIARTLRSQSEARKREVQQYGDVDTAAAIALLCQYKAHTLIHGHTHKPAVHTLNSDGKRYVLSDWDANAKPPRLEVMRWTWKGETRNPAICERLHVADAACT